MNIQYVVKSSFDHCSITHPSKSNLKAKKRSIILYYCSSNIHSVQNFILYICYRGGVRSTDTSVKTLETGRPRLRRRPDRSSRIASSKSPFPASEELTLDVSD